MSFARKLFFIFLILSINTFGQPQSTSKNGSDSTFVNPYEAIDKRAKRAPLFVGLSYKRLSNYLAKPYNNDKDKLRSITYWMTQHIKYNFRKASRVKTKLQKPNSTLFKRKGVCTDYALLFKELCQHSGIPAEMVDGYSKGFYFEPHDTLIRADHTWNGVFIDNEWKLVDVLWMGGYAEPKKQYFRRLLYLAFHLRFRKKFKYVKHLDEKYYLADAKEIVETHLPLNTWWQHLKTPVPVEVFESDSMDWFLLRNDDNLSGYDFKGKIWQDRNGKKPDHYLIKGKEAHEFNKRNNRVLAFSFLDYGCYLGNETYGSNIANEEKIEIYNNAIDSLKKGKAYNKIYKQNIKEELLRRKKKNKKVYNRLLGRNNKHIKVDRGHLSSNVKARSDLSRLSVKHRNEFYRLKQERRNIGKLKMVNVKTKNDSSKIVKLVIDENNKKIKLLRDSINRLRENNISLLKDTFNVVKLEVKKNRALSNKIIDTCLNTIQLSCEMRHLFLFNWYNDPLIDSIETSLFPRFKLKDSAQSELYANYDKYLIMSNQVIRNNKKASKFYKRVLKLIKANKKNNVYNQSVEDEFDEVKSDWVKFTIQSNVAGSIGFKATKKQLISDKKKIKKELKKLGREKTVERQRQAYWSKYYILNKVRWTKKAILTDKDVRECIQNNRAYIQKAKNEIKKEEELQKRREAKLNY